MSSSRAPGEAATLKAEAEQRFWQGVRETSRFFMGQANVHKALDKLVGLIDADGIAYAIIGAMALNEFGYELATVDVDVLLTPDGLQAFKKAHLGRGYLEQFPGSRGLRDTENGVDIDVALTGGFPGDGKPKPVAFPDPGRVAQRGARVALLPLPRAAAYLTNPFKGDGLTVLRDVLSWFINVASQPGAPEAEEDPAAMTSFPAMISLAAAAATYYDTLHGTAGFSRETFRAMFRDIARAGRTILVNNFASLHLIDFITSHSQTLVILPYNASSKIGNSPP